ncbi:MAG: DUF2269 family protein [Acidimicrobiaceae bacterium]|nr:DUF2269 family protein [Acidimicrobiaceae bacterium]
MADEVAYDVFVALHVTAAVVGFGSVALSGVYGGNARRLEQESAAEEMRRYFRTPGRLELAVLAVPVFGAVAVAVGPGGQAFGQVWVSLGLVLWVAAAALLLGIVRPAEAVLRRASLAAERPRLPGPPGGSERSGGFDPPGCFRAVGGSDSPLAATGRRLQWAAAASDLIFVVALVIMVIKPGS